MKNLITLITIIIFSLSVEAQVDTCDDLVTPGTEIPTTVENPELPRLPPPPPPPPSVGEVGDRIVYWGHGYGGNDNSWSAASHISDTKIQHPLNGNFINDIIGFPARKIMRGEAIFGTTETLEFFGSRVNIQIYNQSINQQQSLAKSKENFCISHSMGGLMSRRAALEGNDNNNVDDFRAGGIVTIGTPNHGAQLADNILEVDPTSSTPQTTETFNNFLADASNSLLAGPVAAAIEGDFGLRLLANFTDIQEEGSIVQELIAEFSQQITLLIPYLDITAIDLRKADPSIAALQNASIPVTKAAFYGVESPDITIWRLFYWGVNTPNTPPTGLRVVDENIPHFEATSDDFAVGFFDENVARYEMEFNHWEDEEEKRNKTVRLACKFIPPSVFGVLACGAAVRHRNFARKAREGFFRGWKWFLTSSEQWDYLTGAREMEFVQISIPYCDCSEANGDFDYISLDCTPQDPGDICIPGSGTQLREIYKPNDGVVLRESAIDFRGAVFIGAMGGSNHFQMRNDASTKSMLLTLFDNPDDNPALEFFETEPK